MKKMLSAVLISLVAMIAVPNIAFAHVVVTPKEANTADRVLFSVGVPNEKDLAVTSLKLDVPQGLEDVQPNVMAGWEITTEKNNDTVTSITWKGTIPAGQRADFLFKGQVPAKATELQWKAYQTYTDGTTVSWDQKPSSQEDEEGGNTGPYSVTEVAEDSTPATNDDATARNTKLALAFSVAALGLSIVSLFIRRK